MVLPLVLLIGVFVLCGDMAVRTKQSIEDTRSANVRALTDDYWFSNRKGMSPLDEPLGLEKEAIEP